MQSINGKKQFWGLLCAVSISLIFLFIKYDDRITNFGDAAAMGASTTSLFATRGEHPIHCEPGEALELCIKGVHARVFPIRALWLGNSQLHAVNQLRAGERNAPDILAEQLAEGSIDLVTVSTGNANLQEHMVLFNYLLDRMEPNILILPVVLDDTREDGLRDYVANLLKDEKLRQRLNDSDIGAKLVNEMYRPIAAEDKKTFQERSEAWINSWLDRNLTLWHARPEMRGDLFIWLYRLRNTLFGITSNSKRKVIPKRYAKNMDAYEAILLAAANLNVRVLVYFAPIGSHRGERPYEESEYQRFKEEIATLAQQYGANLENFEDLVPEPLWGQKESTTTSESSELDFMHFTAAGHIIFADQIAKKLFTAPIRSME